MYSACNLNKQGDNIQPWLSPFPVWNQSVVPCPDWQLVKPWRRHDHTKWWRTRPQGSHIHWLGASQLVLGEKYIMRLRLIRLTQSRKSIPYKWVIRDHQECKEKGWPRREGSIHTNMKKKTEITQGIEKKLTLTSMPRDSRQNCCSLAKPCPTLCEPKECSTPVLHYLPEFAWTHIHWFCDAIQLLHSLLPTSDKIPVTKWTRVLVCGTTREENGF